MDGLVGLFSEIIETIINGFFSIYNNVIPNEIRSVISSNSFNIRLFSSEGWFTQPIMIEDLIYYILFTLLLVFLIRLLWKGTKKFFRLVMGVFKS